MATPILDGRLFDQMISLVDELFEAGAVDELKAFGKDVWRNVKKTPEAPHVTVLVFNRIQAALDCLDCIEHDRLLNIYVDKSNGFMTDYRSDDAIKEHEKTGAEVSGISRTWKNGDKIGIENGGWHLAGKRKKPKKKEEKVVES